MALDGRKSHARVGGLVGDLIHNDGGRLRLPQEAIDQIQTRAGIALNFYLGLVQLIKVDDLNHDLWSGKSYETNNRDDHHRFHEAEAALIDAFYHEKFCDTMAPAELTVTLYAPCRLSADPGTAVYHA